MSSQPSGNGVERGQPVPESDIYDVTVIGGGPVGLFAAFYAGLRGARTKIIDSLEELGGAVTALYPEKYIYDVAGFPKILGKDLIANQVEQTAAVNEAVCLGEKALHLERLEEANLLRLTTDKATHYSRTLIIAGGVGAFNPRKLPAPGVERLEGKGIVYFVRSLEVYRDKRVLIVGGGDSAFDWALALESIASQVILIHRTDRFRAHQASVDQTLASTVHVRTFTEIIEVFGDDAVEAVTFKHAKTSEQERVEADAIILALGFVADLGPIKEWGVDIQKNKIGVDWLTMGTSIPGVYAAGDVVTYPTKFDLIATGYAEAVTAANHCIHFIHPEKRLEPGHSSNLTVAPSTHTTAAG
ncbi:MAG: NAD(P)/FAD-dependent oxidoreductase [Chloroflexi bacterium]|nr:NAD(P)/FAD-dependent oxidoreductase [Chloroflexota bacterium]